MGRGILAFLIVLALTGSVGWALVSCVGVQLF
jgi:hypothetical protein